MKSRVGFIGMLVAAVLTVPASGGEIVKCVDPSGHVTLTDQACEAGATSVRLAGDGDDTASHTQQRVVPAAALRAMWKRPAAVGGSGAAGYTGSGSGSGSGTSAAPVRLSGDVATLKAAHRTMLMQDAKPRLATLD